jgi:DNA-binding CsgD family transcriptional regulator
VGEEDEVSELSGREREVLQLIAEGKATQEIADTLFISVKTVEAHRAKIKAKLKLNSIPELTKYAIREGLTSLE